MRSINVNISFLAIIQTFTLTKNSHKYIQLYGIRLTLCTMDPWGYSMYSDIPPVHRQPLHHPTTKTHTHLNCLLPYLVFSAAIQTHCEGDLQVYNQCIHTEMNVLLTVHTPILSPTLSSRTEVVFAHLAVITLPARNNVFSYSNVSYSQSILVRGA